MAKKFDEGRRRFLISTGWVAVGTTVLFSTGCSLPALPTSRDDAEDDANSWLQLRPDGQIYFFVGKTEMGQGVMTALSQLVAEEMRIPFDKVIPQLASTDDIPSIRMTVGSETISDLYIPVRQAAARLHGQLRSLAAEQFNLDDTQLVTQQEGFKVVASNKSIKYRELAKNMVMVDDGIEPQLVPQDTFKIIGKEMRDHNLLNKVTGKARYSHDVTLPGMLHGKVMTPPGFGASLISVDSRDAKRMPGVIDVVVELDENFAGVVAETANQASAALQKIQAKWETPQGWQQSDVEQALDIERLERDSGSGHGVRGEGSLSSGREASAQHKSLHFRTPFGDHAAMETHAAVASVTHQRADLWLATQDAFYHRAKTAKITGLSKSDITVHPTLVGGGFGGKVGVEAAFDAVRLSNAVKRPVRVMWSREETFQRGYFKTPSSHHIEAGVDKQGKISYWRHRAASGPIIFSPAFLSETLQWLTSFVTDKGGARGLEHSYQIKNQEIRYWDEALPAPTGAWRGLGSSTNAFAIESMMDELANAAGVDSVQFRLHHLESESRLARVLQATAKQARWGRKLPAGRAMGVACGIYKEASYVAVVAEVSLDRRKNTLRVEKLVCAHDCGLIINPDIVRAQIEGNLIWGCSSALKEELLLKNGAMHATTFDEYGLLRFDECPKMDIILVEDKTHPPTGAGEPALMPTPAAIANAASRLLGKRIMRLPIRL